ncbi:Cthe_2314 family HEPN domain-containing protein [Paenibacillus ferrarius]|uniref:Cthe_2314 family HEPN domain-containing protein n=1 Tax=Paenibacillus ferrarius TaxID=1469647 RepID=UPI003D2B08AC
MLRELFGEPKRVDSGGLLEALSAIRAFLAHLESRKTEGASAAEVTVIHRQIIWSKGFIDALDELEQSIFCCERFGDPIRKSFLEDMDTHETEEYQRFVYFFKNAFIRIFSILDKLGTFMNDLFQLKTETYKSRYSYFTVLRLMHDRHHHGALETQLYGLKMDYKPAMDRLRNLRNMEIHYINAEMLDDLMQKEPLFGGRIHIENVQANLDDIQKGFEMVCRTLSVAFSYFSVSRAKG